MCTSSEEARTRDKCVRCQVAGVISHCGHWHYWHGLVACPVFGDVSIVTCHECRVSTSSRISCYREGCIVTFSYFFHLRTTLLTNEWIYGKLWIIYLQSFFCLLLSSRNPVIPLLMNLYGVVAGSPGRAKSTFKYADPLKIFVLMY